MATVKCPECNGIGKRDKYKDVSCKNCGGTGKVIAGWQKAYALQDGEPK